MISQEVDLVAGVFFKRTWWRCRIRNNHSVLLTNPLLIVPCLRHGAAYHSGDLDPFRTTGQTSVDFSNHRVLNRFWKVHKHGAFSIPRKTLGLRPNDQSCHHETWLHLDLVDWSNTWSRQNDYDRHISLRTTCRLFKPDPKNNVLSEVMSDRSLSSQLCDHSHMMFTILRNMYIITK